MKRVPRKGVDARIAVESSVRLRTIESELAGTPSPPGEAGVVERTQQPPASSPGGSHGTWMARGSAPGRVARSAALLAYRLVRPLVRPVAYRWRGFLLLGMRELVAEEVRKAWDDSLARSRVSEQAETEAILRLTDASMEAIGRSGAQASHVIEQAGQHAAARMAQAEDRMDELKASVDSSVAGMERRIDDLLPAFARIESYALASARRVAVPCGPGEILLRTSVGFVLCPSTDHPLLATLMETGELEPGVRQLIERLLEPDDAFIDIGANIGMHTIAAARAMGGRGRIFAFEAFEPTARLLERTVWLNGFAGMVEVHASAVCDEAGQRTLFLGQTSGHHSLYPLSAQGADERSCASVRCVRLDEALDASIPVELLKMDVEGAELEVLASSDRLIAANPGIGIIAEFASVHLQRTGHSVDHWLGEFERRGLVWRVIDDSSGRLLDWDRDRIGAATSVNLFFARPDSRAWQRAAG